MENEDTLPPADRDPARKSVTLPIWMWKRIENAQAKSGVKSETEIIRQIGAAMFGSHRTLWDYLGDLTWQTFADGSVRALTADGFHIRVAPQTQGRWSAAAWHDGDTKYDIAYPTWQHSLMAAQLAALSGLDELRRSTPENYITVVSKWLADR